MEVNAVSIHSDVQRISDTIECVKRYQNVNVFNWNETLKNKTVVAFGLGKFFKDTHERLYRMCDIAYLCDNNPDYWGKEFYGCKCISLNDLKKIENVFVIAVVGNYTPIRIQMEDMGIESMHISEMHFEYYLKGNDLKWIENALPSIEYVLKKLQDDKSRLLFTEIICKKLGARYSDYSYEKLVTGGEYFHQGIWKLSENERFLDVGAYIGDTVADFLTTTDSKFDKIYTMELSSQNASRLECYVNSLESHISKKIQVINAGAWNENKTWWCDAYGDMDGCAIMQSKRGELCQLRILDEVIPKDEHITTLKMDIEGAEIKALEGAKRIITVDRPKLAICLYHRPEDFWEIPLKIESMCPDYKIYMRHHSTCNYTDTVLYAYV